MHEFLATLSSDLQDEEIQSSYPYIAVQNPGGGGGGDSFRGPPTPFTFLNNMSCVQQQFCVTILP